VNRPDLLRRALASVRVMWPKTLVIDNSPAGEIVAQADDWPVPVKHIPGVSLSFSQSMNFIQATALARHCDACLFMHNDAEAHPGVAEKLLKRLAEAFSAGQNWGVAFTHYDTLAAFNLRAVRQVGAWDTNLPQYFADNDYYRRLQLAGFEVIETSLTVTHHGGASATIKSDPQRAFINSITFPLYQEYYRRKWGGTPGQEQFTKPFNRD
jgi:GT2 family glycosyltransferase